MYFADNTKRYLHSKFCVFNLLVRSKFYRLKPKEKIKKKIEANLCFLRFSYFCIQRFRCCFLDKRFVLLVYTSGFEMFEHFQFFVDNIFIDHRIFSSLFIHVDYVSNECVSFYRINRVKK